MKCILFLFTLFACSLTANAGTFTSTEERADAVNAQLKGNNSYHAHLAREATMPTWLANSRTSQLKKKVSMTPELPKPSSNALKKKQLRQGEQNNAIHHNQS